MKDIWQKPWIWMAAAFIVAFVLSVGLVAHFHAPGKSLPVNIGLQISARVAFLFFWPAYAGGALTSLFGNVFQPLRRHGRNLGLAFAAALFVHLGFVVSRYVLGPAPSLHTLIVFGPAAVCAYLLALLSINRLRQMLPPSFWPPIRIVAMNYIALVFILDFTGTPIHDFREAVLYLPFAALALAGPALNLAAWVQKLRHAPIGLGRAPVPRGGLDRPLGP